MDYILAQNKRQSNKNPADLSIKRELSFTIYKLLVRFGYGTAKLSFSS